MVQFRAVPPRFTLSRSSIIVVGFLAAGILLSAAQYGATLSYGFHYDDYHFVRPYTVGEVIDSFSGPWDRTGIEVPFFRPLTVAFYAARFHLLRMDDTAYHLASVVLFGLAGAIGAIFAARVSGAMTAGLWFILFWTAHPSLPVSLVVWITNQMHLVESVLLFCALLYWWRIRASTRPLLWLPLYVFQVLIFMVKEDGILLLPFLILCHTTYRLLVDKTCRHVHWTVVVSSAVLLGLLVYGRSVALGGLGGYGPPKSRADMWANLLKGPTRAFLLRPTPTASHVFQAWFVAIALVCGAAVSVLRDRRAAFLICTGTSMALLFNMPFALVTKAEQYHFIGAGSVMALAGAMDALTRRVPVALRFAAAPVALAAVVAMSATSRGLAGFYEPFSPLTLSRDEIVLTWAAVPDEIKEWLAAKPHSRSGAGIAESVPYIVFGAGGKEQDRDGHTYRWTSDRTVILVNNRVNRVDLTVRALMLEQPRRPFLVDFRVEGTTVVSLKLSDDALRRLPIPMWRSNGSPRRMHLMECLVDHTWVPGPADNRRLGIVMYEPSVHPAIRTDSRSP